MISKKIGFLILLATILSAVASKADGPSISGIWSTNCVPGAEANMTSDIPFTRVIDTLTATGEGEGLITETAFYYEDSECKKSLTNYASSTISGRYTIGKPDAEGLMLFSQWFASGTNVLPPLHQHVKFATDDHLQVSDAKEGEATDVPKKLIFNAYRVKIASPNEN